MSTLLLIALRGFERRPEAVTPVAPAYHFVSAKLHATQNAPKPLGFLLA